MNLEGAIKLLKQEPDFSLSYYKREKAIDILLEAYENQQKEIESLYKIRNIIFEKEKSKYNQVFGMTAKIEKDYIPIARIDLMAEKLREKGYGEVDIIEKQKIKYALDVLYQLYFKLSGE